MLARCAGFSISECKLLIHVPSLEGSGVPEHTSGFWPGVRDPLFSKPQFRSRRYPNAHFRILIRCPRSSIYKCKLLFKRLVLQAEESRCTLQDFGPGDQHPLISKCKVLFKSLVVRAEESRCTFQGFGPSVPDPLFPKTSVYLKSQFLRRRNPRAHFKMLARCTRSFVSKYIFNPPLI